MKGNWEILSRFYVTSYFNYRFWRWTPSKRDIDKTDKQNVHGFCSTGHATILLLGYWWVTWAKSKRLKIWVIFWKVRKTIAILYKHSYDTEFILSNLTSPKNWFGSEKKKCKIAIYFRSQKTFNLKNSKEV